MTFAAPLFLLAVLAGAVPVILHLVSRRRAKVLPFPTLRFLRISVQQTRRRKRIHDLLLMFVRILLLLLIAVGLARPALTTLGSLWGGGESAVAIVLDNSASMGVVDRGAVRFRTALHATEQILDQLRDGDQLALLVACGPQSEQLDRTHDAARQTLRNWLNAPSDTGGVSYQRANLALKVEQARSWLEESPAANKQIYVLTDLQQLCWGDLDEDPDGKESRRQPAQIPVIIVDCNRAPKPNVAISGVDLTAVVPATGRPIAAVVELFNAAPVAQQRHLELYIGDRSVYTSPALEIPPNGRLRHTVEFTLDRGGLRRGEVRLAGEDGSALDDRRFFTVEVDREIPVAVIKSERHEIPYLDDGYYLEQALAAGAKALRVTTLLDASLPNEPLAGYKVLFCVNLAAPDRDAVEKLRAYVAGGGNLVWICGDNVVAEAYNRMNRDAGGSLLPVPLLEVRTPGVEGPRDSWHVSSLDAQHPALRHLLAPPSLYQSVLVMKHVRLDTDAVPEATVLARLDDGEALLVERSAGQGKVLLLATGVQTDWTNLPLRPIFMPLCIRMVFDLAGTKGAGPMLLAGSPIVLPLAGQTGRVGVEILLPGGEPVRMKGEEKVFRYHHTHQVGVYEVRVFEASRPQRVAYSVNVDSEEAEPTKIPREQLRKRLAPAPVVYAEDPEDLSSTFTLLREGKSLWSLFLSAVLAFLVLETFLANRLSGRKTDFNPFDTR